MKKNTFTILLFMLIIIFSLSSVFSQEIFLNEGFETGLPEGWIVYNQDGDNNEWEIINQSFWAMTGAKAISLETTTGANDWLVSEQIYLQETYILSFWATEIVEGSQENITVWLSTTGNATTDFTVNLSDITVPYLGYDDDGFLYTNYLIDLSDYHGSNVYIAWQLTSPTQDGLCLIDNISTNFCAEGLEWTNISSHWIESIDVVSDGGYITGGGEDGNLCIQKLNSEGHTEWTTYTNGGYSGDFVHSVIETFDSQNNPSGFAVTGKVGKQGNYNMLIRITKYDTEGTLEWTYETGANNDQNDGYSIKQTNDGGYIVTGYRSLDTQIILIKLDENGNEQWQETYGNTDLDIAKDVVHTADGGFAITGYYRKNYGDISSVYILKTDSLGNEEFWKQYPDTDFARADGIIQTTDGGYILCAFNNENVRDWWIIKTDNIGELEWEYTIGGADEDIPSSIIQTAEENYVIAGFKKVNDKQRMWLVKLNPEGELISETEYETISGESRIHQIKQTYDGGYVFSGVSTVFSENVDGFTAKIEQDETNISQNDIISFYISQQTDEAIIDDINHTVTIIVSDQTNITALTPVIFTSAQSKIFPRSAITQNFSEDFIYTITALDQTPQEWTIIVEGGTTEINHLDNNFLIYPNPSNGIFTIETSKPVPLQREFLNFSISKIVISDITGKIIYSSKFQNFSNLQPVPLQREIDISNQPAGIFFINIQTETGIYTEKLIIQ